MNRQYIGARYVPILCGEYDVTRSYEALSIVLYNYGSYTSKKPVPAGVLPTDGDYWAFTGNYNAQLAQLQADLNALDNKVSHLKDRKFLFLGDSYGDGAGKWSDYVKTYLNIDGENIAVSGAGFVSNGVLTFKDQLVNYSGNRDEITDIVICGGLNDSVSDDISNSFWTTLRTNILDFVQYARANYINAKIYLGYIGNCIDSGALVSGRVYAARQLCKYFYHEITIPLGVIWLNNVDLALCTAKANIDSDNVHPSIYGQVALGMAISSAIISGDCYIKYPLSEGATTASYPGSISMKYEVDNNQTKLYIDESSFFVQVADGTNIGATPLIANLFMYFNKPVTINVTVRLDNFNDKAYQFVPARLWLNGDKAYLYLYDTESDNSFRTNYTPTSGYTGIVRVVNVDAVIPTQVLA